MRARRALLLVLILIGVVLSVMAVVILVVRITGQGPPSLPPEAVEARRDCSPWPSDEPPNPSVAVPTEVQAVYVADEQRIGILWRDDADNEPCYGVVQTTNVPPELAPDGRPTLIVVTLADANSASTPARPGRSCFRVYAGTSAGRSALSEEVCVDVPT